MFFCMAFKKVKVTYGQGDTYEGEFSDGYRNGFGKNINWIVVLILFETICLIKW